MAEVPCPSRCTFCDPEFFHRLLDRSPGKAETPGVAHRSKMILALVVILTSGSGCGALLLVGGAGTSAIAFATGELRSTEEVPFTELDRACQEAIGVLGYDRVEVTRSSDRVRWQARTASGDPVDIRILSKGPQKTELRIRVGVFGDETRSRLVLEQIHQSLSADAT